MRSRNRKKKNYYLLLAIVLGITLGFALLSTTLKINGIASIKDVDWDIHWDKASIHESDNSVEATIPADTTDAKNQVIEFSAQFELPGDYYEFTVDMVNTGSVDGILSDDKAIKKGIYAIDDELETTGLEPANLIYTIVYADDDDDPSNDVVPATGDILKANGGTKKYKVRVEYDKDAKTVPNQEEEYKFKFEVFYTQHKDNYKDYEIGDYVLYNPVTLEYCSNKNESNCYEWIVTKTLDDKIDLIYLREPSELEASSNNGFTLIENYTSTWNNKLKVDSTYNIPSNDNFAGYDYDKARLPIPEDLSDAVNNRFKEYNIGLYMGDVNTNAIILNYDNNYWGIRYYTAEPILTFQTAALQYNFVNYGNFYLYAHPIIRVEKSKEKSKTKTCVDFINDSWSEIKTNINKNPKAYPLGCEKNIYMGSDSNNNYFFGHAVRIANRNACTNGETSETACGVVFEFADVITKHIMNPYSNSGNSNGDGNTGGWKHSEIRTYLNNDIYNALPSDLKAVIETTKVISDHGYNDSSNFETNDNIYLLSFTEVFGPHTEDALRDFDTAQDTTRQLDYYNSLNVTRTSHNSITKNYRQMTRYTSQGNWWWLRTPNSHNSQTWYAVSSSSFSDNASDGDTCVSPAFKIN